ncbi:hypothetical protein FRX31_025660 [Thalictrum thalictroides]|uniref:Uncharacterized protein n=1 Tax=Thalictrum thalictroides TaxID=46969 RepID=A0A7J6VK94_THATH|nr:hypothetical protein FRX31_025660 [Thalictrum thalictroides]
MMIPQTSTAVGVEVANNLSSITFIAIDAHHSMLDKTITVKTRVNNDGMVSAVVMYEWQTKSLVAVTGEFNTFSGIKSIQIRGALAHSTTTNLTMKISLPLSKIW